MSSITVMFHLREGDDVEFGLSRDGSLWVDFGDDLSVMISPDRAPTQFARFCKIFDLQKETAPSRQARDGSSDEKTHTQKVGG